MNKAFKIAVLGSTRGTDFQAILDEIDAGAMPGVEPVVVLSNVADAGILQKAIDHKIPGIFVNPDGHDSKTYEEALIASIGEVDLLCLVGFMRILSPVFVRHFAGKIINVHPSLLPKYGGKGFYGDRIHKAVLRDGETESGMTIHYVDELVDHGEVILQKKVAIEAGETIESLKKKVQELEKKGYPEAIRLIQGKS
ncbi:phosphoribosylglycinamide formyltransferase [Candidatus Peregrinibacteria bacterium]|jgi:phosphoribosylglycinamide formyltransferase 1|nr:phosphoribosylglycinamide formyltransferase [Candidatus Peregrinibacteria bacterium]MBT4631532.1 phosphoribosylglycinamide formyltransferase [Candidatus Peregrinibacteria bacterium]MBT5516373.1 phosphoribosylglycinamide formyltransferase [Candidatus Peregrinibacteria bacterium]MBT5824270.1 phosphoribosylglycinamide formyltransferase [Candidatus Peregrinibacteria bacterium]